MVPSKDIFDLHRREDTETLYDTSDRRQTREFCLNIFELIHSIHSIHSNKMKRKKQILPQFSIVVSYVSYNPSYVGILYTVYYIFVVFTLKTVLTSIQYLLFLTLQGKETNFRGHKLTQNKVQKNKKDPEKVSTPAREI